MPRNRKRERYAPEIAAQLRPEINVLLRDAQPTRREIDDEPDATGLKARRAEDALLSMYCDHARAGTLRKLDFRVRQICKQIAIRNGGRLPTVKGGRPSPIDDKHRNLLFALAVEIEVSKDRRQNVRKAIEHVAKTGVEVGVVVEGKLTLKRVHLSSAAIKNIYYHPDEGWQQTIRDEFTRWATGNEL